MGKKNPVYLKNDPVFLAKHRVKYKKDVKEKTKTHHDLKTCKTSKQPCLNLSFEEHSHHNI